MPMQKKSTTVKFEITESVKASPKQTTVNLIKQFARVYSCNHALHHSLGSFILN